MQFDLNILLLAVTLVYGPLRFLTLLRAFDARLTSIIDSLVPFVIKNQIVLWVDTLFFYSSLIYQAYFWLLLLK